LNETVSPSGQAREATHPNAPVHTAQVNELGALPRTPLEYGAPNVVSRDWMHLVDPHGRPPSLSSSDSNSEKDDTIKVLMARVDSMAKKLVDVESDMQSEALKNEMLRVGEKESEPVEPDFKDNSDFDRRASFFPPNSHS